MTRICRPYREELSTKRRLMRIAELVSEEAQRRVGDRRGGDAAKKKSLRLCERGALRLGHRGARCSTLGSKFPRHRLRVGVGDGVKQDACKSTCARLVVGRRSSSCSGPGLAPVQDAVTRRLQGRKEWLGIWVLALPPRFEITVHLHPALIPSMSAVVNIDGSVL